MFSKRDALNTFGVVSSEGDFPNKIYVGRALPDGSIGYGYPRPSKGGEASIPYYVEFCVTDGTNPPTGVVTLNVYGAEENDSTISPTTGWNLIGSLSVSAGNWKDRIYPRVAISEKQVQMV